MIKAATLDTELSLPYDDGVASDPAGYVVTSKASGFAQSIQISRRLILFEVNKV